MTSGDVQQINPIHIQMLSNMIANIISIGWKPELHTESKVYSQKKSHSFWHLANRNNFGHPNTAQVKCDLMFYSEDKIPQKNVIWNFKLFISKYTILMLFF